MEKLRKDMEKTRGETAVLSTGLKDGKGKDKAMMDEEDEEEEDDIRVFSDDEDAIDEDEDEEVAGFSF